MLYTNDMKRLQIIHAFLRMRNMVANHFLSGFSADMQIALQKKYPERPPGAPRFSEYVLYTMPFARRHHDMTLLKRNAWEIKQAPLQQYDMLLQKLPPQIYSRKNTTRKYRPNRAS